MGYLPGPAQPEHGHPPTVASVLNEPPMGMPGMGAPRPRSKYATNIASADRSDKSSTKYFTTRKTLLSWPCTRNGRARARTGAHAPTRFRGD